MSYDSKNYDSNFDFQSKFVSQEKPKQPHKLSVISHQAYRMTSSAWQFIRHLSPKTLLWTTMTFAAACAVVQAPPHLFHYLEVKSANEVKLKEMEVQKTVTLKSLELEKIQLAEQEKINQAKSAELLKGQQLVLVKKISTEDMTRITAWLNTQRITYNQRLDELVGRINAAAKKHTDYDSGPALVEVAKLRAEMNTHYNQRTNELNQAHIMLTNGMEKALVPTYDKGDIITSLLWWHTAAKLKIEAPYQEIDDVITKWAPHNTK